MQEYRLFYPESETDLRFQYPELMSYEEFKSKGLSQKEMLLIWYFANKTSPLYEDIPDDRQRITQALVRTQYKEGDGKSSVEQLKSLNFSKEFNDAVFKMASFQPDLRIDAMKVVTSTIAHATDVTDIGIEAYQSDATKLSSYMKTCTDLSKSIIEIVKMVESSFGLSKVEVDKNVEIKEFDIMSHITNKKA